MLSFCPIDSSVYQLLHHTFLQFFTDPVRSVFYVLVRQSKCIQDIFLRLCYRVIKTIYIVGLSCHHEKLSPTCMRLADTILVSVSGWWFYSFLALLEPDLFHLLGFWLAACCLALCCIFCQYFQGLAPCCKVIKISK